MRLFIVAGFLVTFSVPVFAEEPPDLIAYLDQIRDWGMSERAHGDVGGVSGLRLGHSVLTYRKDEQSGRYWPGYRSTTCPNPQAEAEEIAKWQAELSREREADIIVLKGLADSDKSGFVTTDEGYDFRFLVEYGYLAAQLAEIGESSIEALAAASGLSELKAQARLDKYLRVQQQAKSAGLPMFPDVATSTASPN